MNTRIKRYTTLALMALLTFAVACSFGDETEKANKLVQEGQTAITEGERLFTEANAKFTAIEVSDDKEKVKTSAQEVMDGFEKAAGKVREASRKLDEASKLKVNEKFKEYLVLKSKEFAKRADVVEAAKGLPQAIMDSSDAEAMKSKVDGVGETISKLEKEADGLAAQADKIRADNKDKFQQ